MLLKVKTRTERAQPKSDVSFKSPNARANYPNRSHVAFLAFERRCRNLDYSIYNALGQSWRESVYDD